jgi:hypothetical protein
MSTYAASFASSRAKRPLLGTILAVTNKHPDNKLPGYSRILPQHARVVPRNWILLAIRSSLDEWNFFRSD